MFDFLSELFSSFPWIYRGWLWLISADYRLQSKQKWANYSSLYKVFDLLMSITFMILEVLLVWMIVFNL